MALFVIQSTDQTILFGPFVDDTDGKTAETGLTGMTVYLSKNGAASAARNSATAITHDRNGYYLVALNYTDTNTHGRMVVFASPAGALPVKQELTVVPQEIWNALFTDAVFPADVILWNGNATAVADAEGFLDNATALGNMAEFFDGTGYDAATSTIGTVTDLTNAPAGGDGDVLKIAGDATAATNLKTVMTGGNYTAAGFKIKQTETVLNTVNANVTNLGGSAVDFQKLQALAQAAVVGLVTGGTNTTTVVSTLLASTTTGFYKDKTFIALTGTNAGQGGKLVTAYDGSTKRLTIEALTAAMSPSDLFVLVG